jgi:hypothetical protein
MKNKKSSKPAPKPTPQQLPTLDELDKVLRGVDLWEVDKPPEVVAKGRRERRPWLYYKAWRDKHSRNLE